MAWNKDFSSLQLTSYVQVVIIQFTFDEFSKWLARSETSIRRVVPLHGCPHAVPVGQIKVIAHANFIAIINNG